MYNPMEDIDDGVWYKDDRDCDHEHVSHPNPIVVLFDVGMDSDGSRDSACMRDHIGKTCTCLLFDDGHGHGFPLT